MEANNILEKIKLAIESSQNDTTELAALLEITVEDLMERFEDRLIENAEKFGIYQDEEWLPNEEGEGREEALDETETGETADSEEFNNEGS